MNGTQLLFTKSEMVVSILPVSVGGNGEKRNEYREKS